MKYFLEGRVDADLKRPIASALVLIMLLGMVTVSASNPGSATNPLISRSYLEGAFAQSMSDSIEAALGGAAAEAMNRLDDLYKSHAGYIFAPRFTRVNIASGDSITLASGGSFILLSGAATITVTRGTVINVSTGAEVSSGAQITLNQRFFCAENTTAVITASSAATGHVDGFYLPDGDPGVGPLPPPVSHLPFRDVFITDWFFDAVDFVYEGGLFRGTSATTFSPGAPMTRGMFVTVLHRLDGLPEMGDDDDGGGTFSDVTNPQAFYYDAVAWASSNNIVAGFPGGTFRPYVSVTREQMAAIMHRYAEFKERDMTMPGELFDAFPDRGAVSDYAVRAMRWAVSWEVIRGSGGRLLPLNTATRAEVAQIILNYSENIGRD